jgi:hypothetical protein
VQELRDIERLQEQINQEFEREDWARRREDIQNLDIFGLRLSPAQEADLKRLATEQPQRIQEFARSFDIFSLELSPEQERQRRAATEFDRRLREAIDIQRAPREDRPEVRFRVQAEKEGIELTPEREAQLQQLTELRRQQALPNETV